MDERQERMQLKYQLREVLQRMVKVPVCADAVATYKFDGSWTGHKVLDGQAAMERLRQAAPKELVNKMDDLCDGKLKRWDQIQVLNDVLRPRLNRVRNRGGRSSANRTE